MISGVRTKIESVNRLKRLWEHKPDLLKKIFFGLELEGEEYKENKSYYPAGKYCSGEFVRYSQDTQNHKLATSEEIGTTKPRDFEGLFCLPSSLSDSFSDARVNEMTQV
jgi:hypothetical protein